MNHVAIDLGGRESQICVRASNGTVLEERRCPTRALGGLLAAMPKSRIVVETCAEAFGVADAALEHGHEVRVVPAALVRSLGVGARRTKTDRRDAQTLSEVSCRIDLPSVHVPDRESRRRKSLCGMREALVREARRDDLLDRPLAAVHAGPQPKNYAFAEAGLRGRAQDALDAAEGLTLCTLGTPPFPFRHPTTWTGRPGGLPWMRR